MSTTYALPESETESDLYSKIEALVKKNPWAWQSVFAVLGLGGGVAAPVFGAAADVITWFVRAQSVNSYLHTASIVSCALMLPLLIVGALCLDSLEAKAGNPAPADRT